MLASRGRMSGFGLVEVLVALSIVAINAVGWIATMQLVFTLVRRIGELSGNVDPGVVASAACGLGCVLPRAATSVAWPNVHRRMSWRRMRGVSLVEVLLVLAVGAVVLGGLTATLATASRVVRGTTQAVDAAAIQAALPTLLQDLVETAGRGMPSACGLTATMGSGRLAVRRALTGDSIVVDEVFAGLDGGGRPALYLRRVPHARQPWVEDVTEFSVQRIDLLAGSIPGLDRAERVVVRVAHAALELPLDVEIALPHLPCLEPVP